jgi:ABC-type sugar transport system ATPase subunit
VLRVENWSSPGKFRDIHFSLHEGEILGLGGLVGAGRSEVASAIFGLDPLRTGRMYIRGKEVAIETPQQALEAGIGLLPEDRKRQGLVLSMNCRENTSLAMLPALSTAGFLWKSEERALAQRYTDQLRVRTPSIDAGISGLSGGNQQKIALAKWLARQCRILIVDEPTRGVDVGAKSEIHQLLDRLACEGTAILLISSELPELMNLSRRIIVLREGVEMGELRREDFSPPALMRLMAGLQS